MISARAAESRKAKLVKLYPPRGVESHESATVMAEIRDAAYYAVQEIST
jgi:hypothetical protein